MGIRELNIKGFEEYHKDFLIEEINNSNLYSNILSEYKDILSEIIELKIFYKDIFSVLEKRFLERGKINLNLTNNEIDIITKNIDNFNSNKVSDIYIFLNDYVDIYNTNNKSKFSKLLKTLLIWISLLDYYKYGNNIYKIFREEILNIYKYTSFFTGNKIITNLYNQMLDNKNIVLVFNDDTNYFLEEDYTIIGNDEVTEKEKDLYIGNEDILSLDKGTQISISDFRKLAPKLIQYIKTKNLLTLNIDDVEDNTDSILVDIIIKNHQGQSQINLFSQMLPKYDHHEEDILLSKDFIESVIKDIDKRIIIPYLLNIILSNGKISSIDLEDDIYDIIN